MTPAADQLYNLDLKQVERIRKLAHRLNKDLSIYDNYTQHIALQESAQDYEKVGLRRPPEQGPDGEDIPTTKERHELLIDERNKVILALKSSIWSASNALKSDHDNAKELIKVIDEEV